MSDDLAIPVYTREEFEAGDAGPCYLGIRGSGGGIVVRSVLELAGQGPLLPIGSVYLAPRLDLRNHSPTGFNWGYGGSGPAQLALAILADCVGDVLAQDYYQRFKFAVVAGLPHEGWVIRQEDVVDWLRLEIAADCDSELE